MSNNSDSGWWEIVRFWIGTKGYLLPWLMHLKTRPPNGIILINYTMYSSIPKAHKYAHFPPAINKDLEENWGKKVLIQTEKRKKKKKMNTEKMIDKARIMCLSGQSGHVSSKHQKLDQPNSIGFGTREDRNHAKENISM